MKLIHYCIFLVGSLWFMSYAENLKAEEQPVLVAPQPKHGEMKAIAPIDASLIPFKSTYLQRLVVVLDACQE